MKCIIFTLVSVFMIWTVKSNRNINKCPNITDKITCTDNRGTCSTDKDCPDHQICCRINSCVNEKICYGEIDLSKNKSNIMTNGQQQSLFDRTIPIDRIKNMIVFFQRPFFFNSTFIELFWGLKYSTEQALLFLDKMHSLENWNPKFQSNFDKEYLRRLFARFIRIRYTRSTDKPTSSQNITRGRPNIPKTVADGKRNNQTAHETLVDVVRRCCNGRVCLRVCNIDDTASNTFDVLPEVTSSPTQTKTQDVRIIPTKTAPDNIVTSVVDNQTVSLSSFSDQITKGDLSNKIQTIQKNIDLTHTPEDTDTMVKQLRDRVNYLEERLVVRDQLINNLFKMLDRNQAALTQQGQVKPLDNTIREEDDNTRTQRNKSEQRRTLITQIQRANNPQQIQQVLSARKNQQSVATGQIHQTVSDRKNQQSIPTIQIHQTVLDGQNQQSIPTSQNQQTVLDRLNQQSIPSSQIHQAVLDGQRQQSIPTSQNQQTVLDRLNQQSIPSSQIHQAVLDGQRQQSIPTSQNQQTVLDGQSQQSIPISQNQQTVLDRLNQQSIPSSQIHQAVLDGQRQQSIPTSQNQQTVLDRLNQQSIPSSQIQQTVLDGQNQQSIPTSQIQQILLDGQNQKSIPTSQIHQAVLDGQNQQTIPTSQNQQTVLDRLNQQSIPISQIQQTVLDRLNQQSIPISQIQQTVLDRLNQQSIPISQIQQTVLDGQNQQSIPTSQIQQTLSARENRQFVPTGPIQQTASQQHFVPIGQIQQNVSDRQNQPFLPIGQIQQTTSASQNRQFVPIGQIRQTAPASQIQRFVPPTQNRQTGTVSQNQRLQRLRQMLIGAAQTSPLSQLMVNNQINPVNRNSLQPQQASQNQLINNMVQESRSSLFPPLTLLQTTSANDQDDDQTVNTLLSLQNEPQMSRQPVALTGGMEDRGSAVRSSVTELSNQQMNRLSTNIIRNQQNLAEQVRQIQQQQFLLQNNLLQGQLLQNNPAILSLLNLQAQQQPQPSLNPVRALGSLQAQQQLQSSLNPATTLGSLQAQQQQQSPANLLGMLGLNSLQNLQSNNQAQLQQLLQQNQQRTVPTSSSVDTTLLQSAILNSVLNQQQQQQQQLQQQQQQQRQQQFLLPINLAQNIQNIARLSPRMNSQADLLAQQQNIIPQTINQIGQLASAFSNQPLGTNLGNAELQQLAQILQNRQIMLNQPERRMASQLSLLQPPALTVISNDQIQQLLPSIGSTQAGISSPFFNLQAQNQLLGNALRGMSILV